MDSVKNLLTPAQDLVDQSPLDISIVSGSVVEALKDPDVMSEVSLAVFQRPKWYPLWESEFYSNLHTLIPSIKANDTPDKALAKWRYRMRKLNAEGTEYIPRQVGAEGFTSRINNVPISVAVLNTFLIRFQMSPHIYQRRFRKEMLIVRRRWELEENISPDSYNLTPYVMVMPLENYLLYHDQIAVLEEIFEDWNVSIILFEDDSYEESSWYEHPKLVAHYDEEAANQDIWYKFKNKEMSILRKKVPKCKSVEEWNNLREEFLNHLNEEIDIWQTYSPDDVKYSEEEVETITRRLLLRADRIWNKQFNKLYNKKKKHVFFGMRRGHYAEIIKEQKDERHRKDTEFYRNLVDTDVVDLPDAIGVRIGHRGICRRIPPHVFSTLSQEKQEEIIRFRKSLKERRESNREQFQSYHKEYNKLKALVVGGYNLSSKEIPAENLHEWNKFRKSMRDTRKYANKWFEKRIKRIGKDVYNNLTLEELYEVPDEEILSAYCELTQPDTRGTADE